MNEAAAQAGEDFLTRARHLMQGGRLDEALALARDERGADARYIQAVCLRYLGQPDAALEVLDALLAEAPEYARAFQERGHVHLARNEPGAAEQAYHQAVTLNPALGASWKALAGLAERAGKHELQLHAARQLTELARLPPEILSAFSMMYEGRLYKAERLCRRFLQDHPDNVEGMRLLAALGVKSGILDDAEFLLESAVEFEPGHVMARLDYVNVLYRRQKYAASLAQAKRLRGDHPGAFHVEMAYANQCTAVGDFDQAIALYDALVERAPQDPALHLTRGHALKTVGRLDEAIEAYRRAYAARPDFGDAYWSLANLKTYRFTLAEVAAMRAREHDRTTGLEDRVHLCFALGKHYEDVGNYDSAFEHYERGNALRKRQLRYSAERTTERLRLHREVFTVELFERRAGTGCPAPDPIFIVGLPRAGSTLLEQILASHSQIDGTMELQNITAIAQKLDGRRRVGDPPRYPGVVADLPDDQLRRLGEAFIADTRIHRQGAPYFIDKLPNNFAHLGLIHLILPNAKIIDARRHPMACCFSNFKQLFASGQEYSYGLAEVGQYYRDYVDLMDHWDAVLPGKVLRVQHEDVVADLRGQVQRMLEYCGLEFEEACVRFHETERSVRTPSSEQVRQPIYATGLELWRRFEAHMEPLKAALGPVLQRYPIAAA